MLFRSTLIVTLIFTTSQLACAQSFDFSAVDILNRYNAEQKKEDADQINCKKNQAGFSCKYEHKAFNEAVAALKSLNAINGNCVDKGEVIINEKSGKVQSIIVGGDRGDPANLFQTIGRISGMLTVFGISDERAKTLLPDLGLMRGDDDSTIGTATVNIEDNVLIRCNNQSSKISTSFGCAFIPRS